jgi:hypothetical protein
MLPPFPPSISGFGDSLDFLLPDIYTNSTTTPTSISTNLSKPRSPDAEIIVSPTRTLFPSVSRDFEKAEQITAPQNNMTRAKAASLRFRNQELEEERDQWKNKYDELERRHRKLEKEYQDLERGVAKLVAVGADWSSASPFR